MKKIMVLGLGLVVVAVTAGSVFATTVPAVTATNSNCNVSIESKQETLKQYVQDGKITQEKADEITKQLENCDGTGTAKIGQKNGVSFGSGNGQGQGRGMHNGAGGNCQLAE